MAKLVKRQTVIENGNSYEFVDDYIFSSPSTAAAMILGRNANGLTEWKLVSGKTLKEYESSEITPEVLRCLQSLKLSLLTKYPPTQNRII